jgi:LAO/AO transport system kinase
MSTRNDPASLIARLHSGDQRALARCISIVENESSGSREILEGLVFKKNIPVTGITGPPGAGKSTLVNALIEKLLSQGAQRIGVIAVDPTSPFTSGALLGDRLRMSGQFTNPGVYIRSLATRGTLGGLSARAFEVMDVMKASGFDHIIVETVGVGQSEIEIAELADVTVVVFVPESGDEVQAIKSGIVEIADVFVINKADRDGADKLAKTLTEMVHERRSGKHDVPVIKTVATLSEGVGQLVETIRNKYDNSTPRVPSLIYQRALRIAGQELLRRFHAEKMLELIEEHSSDDNFNIHRFVSEFLDKADQ